MIGSVSCIEKTISNNAMLAQNPKLTAGRQNLLSAIWGGSTASVAGSMPNGDPPSLMLWGAEDQMSPARYKAGQSGMLGK